MISLLLSVIYLSFISLGLPDSLLGSAWPVMRVELNAPFPAAGFIALIITAGTIVSSLLSERLTKRFGAGPVTAFSTALTAAALFGTSFSNSVLMHCLMAVPYGLGAGAIDAALNNYVALHYNSRQMSWLHCFWGVGTSISPFIMSYCLQHTGKWQDGYRMVGFIQTAITAVLFLSLPLWQHDRGTDPESGDPVPLLGIRGAVAIPGVPRVLISFFAYCAAETTAGLWASSYLVEARGVDALTAARFGSMFFLGITLGRFLNGFVADRFGDRAMIRAGVAVMGLGVLMILLPFSSEVPALAGLLIFGFGSAPVYPSIIHATPDNFGAENSQAIIGVQMASAYVGSALMPPLFGLLADRISVGLFPGYLLLLTVLLAVMTAGFGRKK